MEEKTAFFSIIVEAKLRIKSQMRSSSLYILLFLLISISTQAQLLELRFLEAEVEQSLEYTTGKKDLMMYYHMNEYGFNEGPFRIEQSFEFNPGYRTVRAKGNLHYGVLSDSLFIYNDKAQIVEKGYFKPISDGKFDTISGYYHGIGLMGIREGKFVYYHSGKGYKDYKLDHTIEFKNGYKDGKEIYYYPDGLDYKLKTWRKDTLNGLYLTKFSTGDTLQKINYVNGKKDGLAISFFHNGNVRDSINFLNGVKNGIETHYYSNGQLKERVLFENGSYSFLTPTYDSLGKVIPNSDHSGYMLTANKVELISDNYWPNFQMPEDIPNYYGYYITKKEYRFMKKFKNEHIQITFKNDTIASLEISTRKRKTKKVKKAEKKLVTIINQEIKLIHLKSVNGVFKFQITNLIKKSPIQFE